MDPVVRTLMDVRRMLRDVGDPFDREELKEYFRKLGEEMGFSAMKNVAGMGARADVVWRDGNVKFLSMNVEFGNKREVLGAVMEAAAFKPEIVAVVTASTPMKRIDDIVAVLRQAKIPTTVIIDVKERRSYMAGDRFGR